MKRNRIFILNITCAVAILIISTLNTLRAENGGNFLDVNVLKESGFLSDTTIVSVSPDSSAINVGDTLSVDILVDSNAVVHGFEIIIDYDENLLDVLKVTEGSLLKGSGNSTFWFVVADSDSVQVNVAILGPVEVNGPGQLFSVKFKAREEGESELIFKVVDIRDMANTTIPAEPINGYIFIGLTSIKDEDRMKSSLPEEYFLAQNYPNPFNPGTQIEYSLPEKTFVSLKVYNINGKLIRTLVTDEQTPGFKIVNWDGKDNKGMNVTSGVYFYAIKTGNFFQANRMLLIK